MLGKTQGIRLDKSISTIKGVKMKNKIVIGDAIRSGNIGLAQGEAIPAVARPLPLSVGASPFRAVRMSHPHSTE